METHGKRTVEKSIAVASFIAAVMFAFTALIIDDGHEMAAGNCTVIAQFLLLTASIFGIDYRTDYIIEKFKHASKTHHTAGHPKP